MTVTMPSELVAGIARIEHNRSRFIAEAERHALQRRQRLDLRRSLEAPHPGTAATARLGLAAWPDGLPPEDDDRLDPDSGAAERWTRESGWEESEQ
ncbi:MAG: hypothetical protein ER33_03325 [Cyanobium sp. CACIAM 14]|nr:MAG: hypothetical protein ER33_03325 [Cyanobium sp. CACIAM 14]